MTSSDADRITDHFEANVRDLTPAGARHAARVLFAPMSHDPEVSRRCASVLSETERQRADRLATDDEVDRFRQRRAFRRFCAAAALGSSTSLSRIAFDETSRGRPFLHDVPDLWFSFSSCGVGMLGAWSSTHRIGVDIEDRTNELEVVELARQFFSAAEADVVEASGGRGRLRAFIRFWNLKEAALKSIGEGLPFGLDAFGFELDPVPRVIRTPPGHGGVSRFRAWVIETSARCGALVIRDPV